MAWGAVVCLLAELQSRVLRSHLRRGTLEYTIEVGLVLGYAATAGVPWAARLLAREAPGLALQHVVATTLCVGCVAWVAFEVVGLRHLRAYGGGAAPLGKLPGRLRLHVADVCAALLVMTVSNFVLVMVMFPSPRESAIIACLFVFMSSLAGLLLHRGIAGFGSRGAKIPFEDAPIQEEVRRIAAAFGWKDATFSLLTTRNHGDEGDQPSPPRVSYALRAWLFDVRKPSTPIELVQSIEPAELTALIAHQYSYATPFHPRRPYRAMVLYLSFVFGGLLACAAFLHAWQVLWGRGRVLVPVLCFVIYTILLCGPFLRWSGLMRRPEDTHVHAFRAWRAAAPDAQRTFAEYARALSVRERLLLRLGDGVDLDRLARRVPGLLRAGELLAADGPESAGAPASTRRA